MTPSPKPTAAELAILRVLWTRGRSTVREVHDAMAGEKSKPVAYTTTLKTLQVMMEKGLANRVEERGQHLYQARHAEDDTLRGLVTDLVDRAFGGSPAKLIVQALASRRASPDELRQIRKLLAEHEGDARKRKNRD
jgi:predicted transcriptional regulator